MHNSTYTSFWEGAMAWTGWWHNQVGLLTEAASVANRHAGDSIARGCGHGPRFRECSAWRTGLAGAGRIFSGRTRFQIAPPRDVTPRADYPRPWLGGAWTLRDIVDYEMISTHGAAGIRGGSPRDCCCARFTMSTPSTIEAGRKGATRLRRSRSCATPC